MFTSRQIAFVLAALGLGYRDIRFLTGSCQHIVRAALQASGRDRSQRTPDGSAKAASRRSQHALVRLLVGIGCGEAMVRQLVGVNNQRIERALSVQA